jgi:hypothetical protein
MSIGCSPMRTDCSFRGSKQLGTGTEGQQFRSALSGWKLPVEDRRQRRIEWRHRYLRDERMERSLVDLI